MQTIHNSIISPRGSMQLWRNEILTNYKQTPNVRKRLQDILKGRDGNLSSDLEGIKYKSRHASSTRKYNSTPATSKKCTCCGKATHPHDKWPPRDAECFKCHKKGHYGSMCLLKKPTTAVSTVQASTEQTDTSETESNNTFLGTVQSQEETRWVTVVKVNNC